MCKPLRCDQVLLKASEFSVYHRFEVIYLKLTVEIQGDAIPLRRAASGELVGCCVQARYWLRTGGSTYLLAFSELVIRICAVSHSSKVPGQRCEMQPSRNASVTGT